MGSRAEEIISLDVSGIGGNFKRGDTVIRKMGGKPMFVVIAPYETKFLGIKIMKMRIADDRNRFNPSSSNYEYDSNRRHSKQVWVRNYKLLKI